MKTKFTNLVLSSTLLFVVLSFSTAPNAFAQAAQSSPEATIKAFYNWHIRSTNSSSSAKEKNMMRRKYLTARCIQESPRFERENEADYFVQSQEWGDNWENNFTVSKPLVRGATATAIVTFPDGYPRVKLTLKREAGAWKIDRVQNAPQ